MTEGQQGQRRVSRDNPSPLDAIEAAARRHAESLARRPDRFSQLLSRARRNERQGIELFATGGLSAEEQAEFDQLRPDAHESFRNELQAATAQLRELLAAVDPIHVASMVMFQNLFSVWGKYFEPTHQGSEAKVELLTGLLATQPVTTAASLASGNQMQSIFDELDHIVEVGYLFNISMPADEDPGTATLRFSSATRWMSLRGDSYAEHGRELAAELYRPHDHWLASNLGFTIDDVLKIGASVTALMRRKVNDLLGMGANALSEALPTDGSSDERLIAAAEAAAYATLVNGIRAAMVVTADEIAASLPSIPEIRVRAVLDRLSVPVGGVDPDMYTGLYDEHPLRRRPFLTLGADYLLVIPAALSRDAPELFEDQLLAGKASFSRQRAATLDRLAIAYLSQVLPGASSWTGLFYEGNELDGLVLFDDVAVVVEGKGNALSVQGQRGDILRLRREIAATVEEAWRQAARARDYILGDGDAVFTDQDGLELIRVPDGSVKEVVVINPTLHELAGHAPQLGRLRALGLFMEQELPWSVFINDLRVITDTAENAAVFLHYLTWRNRLPLGERVIVGDELDLWSSYLLCERFGILHGGGEVMIGNSITDFDAYYDGLAGRGPKVDRPRKYLPGILRSFVQRMAVERPPGWRDAAGACLDLSLPELAALSHQADVVARAAAEGDALWDDRDRLALVGQPFGEDAQATLRAFDPSPADPTIVVVCEQMPGLGARVAWAGYRKPVSFELSAFEREATTAASEAMRTS